MRHWTTTKTPGVLASLFVLVIGIGMAPCCTTQTGPAPVPPAADMNPLGTFTSDMYKYVWAEPVAITGVVNDWDDAACPLGTCGDGTLIADYSFVLVHTVDGTGATLTGMALPTPIGPAEPAAYKRLCNFEVGDLTIAGDDIRSTFNNRFRFLGVNQWVLPVGHCKEFYTLGQQWRPISESPTHTFDDGTLTYTGPFSSADDAYATATTIGSTIGAVAVSPKGTGVTDPVAYTIFANNSARTIDTTAGAKSLYAIVGEASESKSAGGFGLSNVAGLFDARNGDTNYAIQTTGGDVYFALGAGTHFYNAFSDTDFFGANFENEKTLKLGGGPVNGTTTQLVLDCQNTPTPDHGSLDTGSSNCKGRVKTIGANNTVTLTFGGGGYTSTAFCTATIIGSKTIGIEVSTVSGTAPVFSCFTLATGVDANCPDFQYDCGGHN